MNRGDEDGFTALIHTITYNHEKCVNVLLKVGANVNTVSEGGLTALMHAARAGHKNILNG